MATAKTADLDASCYIPFACNVAINCRSKRSKGLFLRVCHCDITFKVTQNNSIFGETARISIILGFTPSFRYFTP